MGKRGPAPSLTEHSPVFRTADITPPPDLTGAALNHWNENAPALATSGVLTQVDRTMFEMLCRAVAEWRDLEAQITTFTIERRGAAAKNPVCTLRNQAQAVVIQLSKEFGLTPVSRGNVTVAPADDDSLADDMGWE